MRIIEIVGGGLCGLALSCGLRNQGVPVVLSEAGSYPRHRVCGEFISGVSNDVLTGLGVSSAFHSATSLRSVRWYRGKNLVLTGQLPDPAMGLSRYALDQALANLAKQAGVDLRVGTRVKKSEQPGRVICAGRLPRPGKWVGLKAHYEDLDLAADLEMHLGRNAYVGLADIGGGVVNVCGLFDKSSVTSREGQLLEYALRSCGLSALAERLESACIHQGSECSVAGFTPGWQKSQPSSLGDSMVMIPPFTGNGMSMAFESASLSVGPLSQYAHGKVDWLICLQILRQAHLDAFRQRVVVAMIMNRILLSTAGQVVIRILGRAGLLPFNRLLQLVR